MADSYIALDEPAVTDKKLDTEQLTVGANTVERERMQIAGTAATDIAPVDGTAGLKVNLGTDNDVTVTGTVTVDGSGVTQPISAASLPLPSGAATESTLSTLNGKVTACNTGAVVIASGTVTADLGTDNDVQGMVAEGAAVGGTKPFLIAGDDGLNVKHIAVDASGNLQVDIVSDGAGLATAANQSTANGLLGTIDTDTGAIATSTASIDGKITACNTGAVVVSSGSITATQGTATNLKTQAEAYQGGVAVSSVAPLNVQVGDGSNTATIRNLAANDALNVAIVDGSGGQITSFGGGTEYTEDAAAAADPVGKASILVRADTPGAVTSTNGDNVAQRGTNYGAAYVQVVDSSGNFIDTFGGGGGTSTADDADFVAGTTLGTQIQGLYESSPTSVTDGDVGQIGITQTRAMRVSVDNTVTVTATNLDVQSGGADLATQATLATIDTDTGNIAAGFVAEDGALGTGVLVQGDDGTDRHNLQTDASGYLKTIAQANNGVDIGDVDVASVVPGTGATNLGKAEDAAHSSSDTGVYALGVRDTDPAAHSGTDGDYESLHVNDDGGLWVTATPSHTGGNSAFTSVDLDESEEEVSGTACTVSYMYFWNTTAAPKWAQIWNATAASVTPGTTAPTYNFMIPANADSDGAGVTIPIPNGGLGFSTALSVAITGAAGTDATDPGASAGGCLIIYKN